MYKYEWRARNNLFFKTINIILPLFYHINFLHLNPNHLSLIHGFQSKSLFINNHKVGVKKQCGKKIIFLL